ncbi:GntR family transcriptional regulator [Parahaliea mediterranea]|uniref:GntR family transcriptional regulator n=1 Tax=Parahaliea mediterranea TaxID=651086 RepID=UPI0014734974|nr:GntR family transcriptional regulator [Parahaliea mediterranea]
MADNAVTDAARLSKTEIAYRRLEEKIVTMALAPGALLSEAELALELGLGRTPVREALQRLAGEHLVEIMPRRGIRVAEIDIGKQLRLLEVRRLLEVNVAGMAARRASREQLTQFAALADALDLAGDERDYLAFLHLDHELDESLIAAADNEFAATMLRQLHGLSRRFWHYYYRREQDLPRVAALHAAIARAVAAADGAAASAASEAHMDYIHDFTRAVLER